MFSKFDGIRDAVELSLVEVSPKLSQMQYEKLSGHPALTTNEHSKCDSYMQCRSTYGPKVSWYHSLQQVPRGFTFYIAHEFFDALPIHKFQVSNHIIFSFLTIVCPLLI